MKFALYLALFLGMAGALEARDFSPFAGTYHGIVRTSGKDELSGTSDGTFRKDGHFETGGYVAGMAFRPGKVFVFNSSKALVGTWRVTGSTLRFFAASSSGGTVVKGRIHRATRTFFLSIYLSYPVMTDPLPLPTPSPSPTPPPL